MKKLYYLILIFSINFFAQPQWSPLTSIVTNSNGQRFDDVFFINENVGWAANGFYAAVYKTLDGGSTWTLQMSNATMGTNYYFRNIEFLDENIGFLGTLNGVFLKTINGGISWTTVTNFSTNPIAICGLDTVGTSTIFGCGAYFSPAFIIKSIDSGVSWQYIDMSAYASGLVEVVFLDENVGYASGKKADGGVVLKTIDGGITWTEIYNSAIAGEYVWKLQILNSNAVFGSIESVAPNPGRLIRSLDAGATWISKIFPDTEVQAVGFITENHGWMGGHYTGLYETIDGGNNWVNTSVGSNLNRIFIINDNLAYACGTTIYKFSTTLSTAEFTEQDRILLKAAVIPNPVADKLNLSIEFKGNDHVVIELYDNLGRFIKELTLDTITTSMIKNYTFDFPYPPGIYYINLHTNTGRQSLKVIKK